jgi:acyl-ACP thioesterase
MNNFSADTYEQSFYTPYSEVGPDACLKPAAFFNLCQDIASIHADQLGISALHMGKAGKTWVVYSYQLKFYKFPEWNEAFTVKSDRMPLKKLYELRSFYFIDLNGDLLAEGKCAWVLVDKKNGRPARLDKFLPENLMKQEKVISFDFKNYELPDPDSESREFRVLKNDIDFNIHANNTSYIKWGLEMLPSSKLNPCKVKSIEIKYKKDIALDKKLQVLSQNKTFQRKNIYVQSFTDLVSGDLLAQMNIETL